MDDDSKRAEAERCLGVAENLLLARDLVGSRNLALRVQESDPLRDGSDQILAVADVLLAAEKRINNHLDWYAILQLQRQSDDLELVKRQYRRLALLLHPDKNKFAFADSAFKLVADAWAVLSNPSKKCLYDNELNLFSKFDSVVLNDESEREQKQRMRRSPGNKKRKASDGQNRGCGPSGKACPLPLTSFWTACPYCYFLYEYPRIYEDCCLRCQNCQKGFHASLIPSPPPMVPGKEAYFCCWGFFPLGFSVPNLDCGTSKGFPNSMPFPPVFQCPPQPAERGNAAVHKTSLHDEDSWIGNSEGSGDASVEWSSRKKGKAVNAKERASSRRNARKSQWGKVNEGEQNSPGLVKDSSEPLDGSVIPGGIDGIEVPSIAQPQMRNNNMAVKNTEKDMGKGPEGNKEEMNSAQTSGELDLNVENTNESGDVSAMSDGMWTVSGEEEATAGTGFFEGLDDILAGLPILNVVEEEKVEAA